MLEAIAWYDGNSFVDYDLSEDYEASRWIVGGEPRLAGTRRVAQKQPNRWGLYDMLGNVYEWCLDDMRSYGSEPVRDPLGPGVDEHRVIRGGSWIDGAMYIRAAHRDDDPPDMRNSNLGMRLCLGHALQGAGIPQPG